MTAARIEKLRTALRRIDDSPERSRLIATSALVIDDRAAEDDKEKECETSKTPWKTEHCASSSSASLSSARASSGLGESHEEIANRVWNDWPESLAHMPKYAVAVHEEIVRCQSGEGSSAVSGNYSSADTTSTNGPTSGRSTSKASPSPGRSLSRPSQTDASSAASPADLPAELEARLWSAIRWNVTPDLMMRLRSAVAPLAADLAAARVRLQEVGAVNFIELLKDKNISEQDDAIVELSNENDRLRADLAAAVKVVEAARPFRGNGRIAEMIRAFDARKKEPAP